jgi:hypothetical protein
MSDRNEIIFTVKMTAYNPEFIEYMKRRVPPEYRSYDEETKIWTIADTDGKTLNALTGVAAQKFSYATLWRRDDNGGSVIERIK